MKISLEKKNNIDLNLFVVFVIAGFYFKNK
jgi:hypothetical protein